MIEVNGLTKYYGRLAAIKDVNFRVETGEIVGFLGPNGAGKTTTMRILTCFSPASSGEARILGMDVREEPLKIRQKIGYLPENVPLYDWMRVGSYLKFVARAKGIPWGKQNAEVERVSNAVAIYGVRHKIIKSLSKGYKQRVGLAQALIGDPAVLILDEPTIGLDPKQIREIRELIKGFSRNRTVILSSHILPEVSQVCDRVMIINHGSIIAEDSPRNLALGHGKSARIQLIARAPGDELYMLLSGLPHVLAVSPTNKSEAESTLLVEAEPESDIRPDIARAILNKGWDLLELRQLQATLEDVFIDLVTTEAETEASESEVEPEEAAS
jgi:ABC-2 type transport system ATP-binding protein